MNDTNALCIKIKFTGGAELLFDNIKQRDVELPPLKQWKTDSDTNDWTIRHLLQWMVDNILTERPEMFIQKDSVRPGILVLVNDTDWELVGQLEYKLQSNDTILFMSTLHGG